MKKEYIYYYKKRLIKKGLSENQATELSEKAWKKYYALNKDKIDQKIKNNKASFEKAIDLEFRNIEIDYGDNKE